MFTAAAAAASADVRAKRNRFASHRSFSASELNGIKRRQKQQTANALDILSTYLVVGTDDASSNHLNLRGGQSSARTSIASSRESSRACSPVVEECTQQQQQQGLLPRNSPSSGRSAANTFFTNFFSSLPSDHPHSSQHHKASLSLPTANGSLQHSSSHSHSTSSIVEHCSNQAGGASSPASSKPAVEVVALLRDPAWNEIARLSHSDDMEDVDGHGHRCGHRRRYDRQNPSPFDAYMARKRFISAINRIRMESMVCSALSPNNTAATPSGRKVSALTEYSELAVSNGSQQPGKGTRKGSSPLPPQVLINDDEQPNGGDDHDDDGDDHHSSTTTISMAELSHELGQTQAALGQSKLRSSGTPARASSSPQIAQQEHYQDQQQQQFDDGLNWAPLMQGRAIERSTSSATHRPPANFTCSESRGSGNLHLQQQEITSAARQRSCSATSTTMFLEQEAAAAAAAAAVASQNRSKSPNRSPEKRGAGKHSFMALIRIKMFSVKRQRRPLKMDEKEEEVEEDAVGSAKPKV